MSNRRLTRTSADIAHIRSQLRWMVFEVTISLVRRTNDRGVLLDVAINMEHLAQRLRQVAARKA